MCYNHQFYSKQCQPGCAFKKMNLLSGDDINLNKISNYINKTFSGNSLAVKVYQQAISICSPVCEYKPNM